MTSLGMDRDAGRLTCSEGVSVQYGPKDKSKPSMKASMTQLNKHFIILT